MPINVPTIILGHLTLLWLWYPQMVYHLPKVVQCQDNENWSPDPSRLTGSSTMDPAQFTLMNHLPGLESKKDLAIVTLRLQCLKFWCLENHRNTTAIYKA